MSQDLSINFTQYVFDLNKDIQAQLLKFNFDADWTENEDYFKDDTLELGYNNDAERLVLEFLETNKVTTIQELYKWVEHFKEHVYSTDDYYKEYQFSLYDAGNGKIVIAYYVQSGC